jgi:hypothetical protein
MHATRTRTALSLLSIPVVVAVVLLGIWITGGLITNDFTLSMWLTAGWMGLSGVICLAVAARSRRLRWPVLGAYVAVAVAAGAYLGSSLVFDDVVREQVAVAVAAPASAPRGDQPPRNIRLRAGRFEAVGHPARGAATLIRLAEGGRVLTLTNFEVDNGPDLRLYLVAGPARSEGEVDDFVDLGALKGNRGDQQYEIPRGVDLGRYTTPVVWCRAFSVLFARAPTR